MVKHISSSIITIAVLAFGAAFLSQFTPHPSMAVLLGFSLVRSFFLQLQLVRLSKKVEHRQSAHYRLASRLDRLEWETIGLVFNRRSR